jgi:hypothetical protein
MTENMKVGQFRNLFIFISAVLSFFIFIDIGVKHINTDILAHSEMIKAGIEKHSLPVNFLYYLTVYVLSGFSLNTETLFFVSLFILSIAVVLKFYFSSVIVFNSIFEDPIYFSNVKIVIIYTVLLLILIIHPIITPLDYKNGFYYLGKASINIWHNSTTVFVMPFVLLLFYYSYLYLQKPLSIFLFLILGFGILIVLIKPSFLFTFLIAFPSLLCARFKISRPSVMGMLFISILFIIIALEYLTIYSLNNYGKSFLYYEKANIVFAPFQAWSHYSENIPVDLISSIAFPLLFAGFYFDTIKKSLLLQYSWLLFIIALVIGVLFNEDGYRMWHLNLFWQVPMTNYILFLVSSMLFLKIIFQKKRYSFLDYTLIIVWVLHLSSGVAYLKKILFLSDYH